MMKFKRKVITIVTILAMLFTTALPSLVFADEGMDMTSPTVNSIKIGATKDLTYNDFTVPVEFDITEEGVGVTQIFLSYRGTSSSGEATTGTLHYDCEEGSELFTGTHQINFKSHEYFKAGTYELEKVCIIDANENESEYRFNDEECTLTCENMSLNVIDKRPAEEDKIPSNYQQVTKLNITKTTGIDASEYLEMEITINGKTGRKIWYMYLEFANVENPNDEVSFKIEKNFSKGTYVVKLPIKNELCTGKYYLQSVEVTMAGNGSSKYREVYPDIKTITGKTKNYITISKSTRKLLDTIAPKITKAELLNQDIVAPELLNFKLDTIENNKIKSISLTFSDSNGRLRTLRYDAVKNMSTGSYTISIPVSPFWSNGRLALDSVTISDTSGNSNWYYPSEIGINEDGRIINVSSSYNIKYFGSLSNSKVTTKVAALEDGDTAVLDCRKKKTAPKALFTAIAGRDITVVFVNDDLEWVINGKDVVKSQCKDIVLKADISVVNGYTVGFANDKKVINIDFPKNGKLPGKMKVRVNGKYIIEKYKFDIDAMDLYYVTSSNIKTEKSSVAKAQDSYIEFEITHNSRFALSQGAPVMGPIRNLKATATSMSSIKLTWSRASQATGYYVYKSTSGKKGTWKKIATIKNPSTTRYTAKKLKSGKKYYFRVKGFNKSNERISRTARFSQVVSATPKLKAPSIDSVSQYNSKTQFMVEWNKVKGAKGYKIYRSTSKNGKYKKLAYTKKNYYLDKKIKANKNYYYKVIAVHKSNSKYNSSSSNPKGDYIPKEQKPYIKKK